MFYVTLHVSFKDAGANADLVELCLLGHEVMKYPLLAEFDEFVHRRGRLFNQS